MVWTPTKGSGTRIPEDLRFRSSRPSGSVAEGGVPGKPGELGGKGQRVQTMLAPHIFPPYNASFFRAADSASFAGAVTAQKFTGTLGQGKITIPQGNVGVVRELTFYVAALLVSSQISFDVLVNDSPVEGYSNLFMPQIAAAAFSFSPDVVFIPVKEGNTIQVRATVGDAVTYTLSYELRGWSFSKEIAEWWKGVFD